MIKFIRKAEVIHLLDTLEAAQKACKRRHNSSDLTRLMLDLHRFINYLDKILYCANPDQELTILLKRSKRLASTSYIARYIASQL